MDKNKVRIFMIGIVLLQVGIFASSLTLFQHRKFPPIDLRGVKIAVFLTDGFTNEEFYSVIQYLHDDWGAKISTIAFSSNVTAAEGNSTLTDILFSDLNDITNFHAIFIPGGNGMTRMSTDPLVLDLLQQGDAANLVIASVSEGTDLVASAGLLTGKHFTASIDLIDSGGIYLNDSTVVVDDNIITATPPNYEELSYTLANTLGYSYTLAVDIQHDKEPEGWSYSIVVESSDSYVIQQMSLNLSLQETENTYTFIKTQHLVQSPETDKFSCLLGILPNGEYRVIFSIISIYGRIEIRELPGGISVGGN